MNDNTLDEASVAASAWQELAAETPEIAFKAGSLIATVAEAAHRHRVMVSITVTPYECESDADDEG